MIPSEGFLREFVEALAPTSEAPAEGYLGAGLALLSACLGPQLRTQYRSAIGDQVVAAEYGHVWTLLLGPSAATHRTTIAGAAKDFIKAVQRRIGTSWHDHLRLHRLSAGRVSDAGILHMLAAKDEDEADEWFRTRPPGRFIDANEVAPLFGPEAGARDEKWAADARHLLLSVYDGEVSSETVATAVPPTPVSAGIFANATRAGLEERLRASVVQSGFFARWVPMIVTATDKSFATPPITGAAARLDPWIDALAETIVRGGIVDHTYQLYVPEALQTREAWYDPINRDLKARAVRADDGEGDPLDGLRLSAFKRWQATANRLAVLHAVARQLRDIERLQELSVEVTDVVWGIDVVGDAMVLLDDLLAGADTAPTRHRAEEDRIVRALNRHGGRATIKEVRRSTGMSSAEARLQIDQSDLLAMVKVPARGAGRPREVVYLADRLSEDEVIAAERAPT